MFFNFSGLKMINRQTFDYSTQIDCLLKADYPLSPSLHNVIFCLTNGKTTLRLPNSMVTVTSVMLKKHVVSYLGSIDTVQHKLSSSNNLNDVKCSFFIIVNFSIQLTSFNATWDGT